MDPVHATEPRAEREHLGARAVAAGSQQVIAAVEGRLSAWRKRRHRAAQRERRAGRGHTPAAGPSSATPWSQQHWTVRFVHPPPGLCVSHVHVHVGFLQHFPTVARRGETRAARYILVPPHRKRTEWATLPAATAGCATERPTRAVPAMRLVYSLRRGANGLGVDVDARGVVAEVVADGQAAADSMVCAGDVIEIVDGVALAGRSLSKVLVPGCASYELVVTRAQPGALGAQALAAGLVSVATEAAGNSQQPQVHGAVQLVCARVRRGPNGLGVDLGKHSRVTALVPGSPAASDAVIQVGDLIASVDGQHVGVGTVPPLIKPNKPWYLFILMRPISEGTTHARAVSVAAAGGAATVAAAGGAATAPMSKEELLAAAAAVVAEASKPITEAELDKLFGEDDPSGKPQQTRSMAKPGPKWSWSDAGTTAPLRGAPAEELAEMEQQLRDSEYRLHDSEESLRSSSERERTMATELSKAEDQLRSASERERALQSELREREDSLLAANERERKVQSELQANLQEERQRLSAASERECEALNRLELMEDKLSDSEALRTQMHEAAKAAEVQRVEAGEERAAAREAARAAAVALESRIRELEEQLEEAESLTLSVKRNDSVTIRERDLQAQLQQTERKLKDSEALRARMQEAAEEAGTHRAEANEERAAARDAVRVATLALEGRIHELEGQLGEKVAKVGELEAARAKQRKALEAARAKRDSVSAREHELEVALRGSEGLHEAASAREEELHAQLQLAERKLKESARESVALHAKNQATSEAQARRLMAIEGQLLDADARLKEAEATAAKQRKALEAARSGLMEAGEERTAARGAARSAGIMREKLEGRIHTLEEQLRTSAAAQSSLNCSHHENVAQARADLGAQLEVALRERDDATAQLRAHLRAEEYGHEQNISLGVQAAEPTSSWALQQAQVEIRRMNQELVVAEERAVRAEIAAATASEEAARERRAAAPSSEEAAQERRRQTSATESPDVTGAEGDRRVAVVEASHPLPSLRSNATSGCEPVASASNVLGVLWDIETCPLGRGKLASSRVEHDGSVGSLTSQIGRLLLRVHTACGRGSPLGRVEAFGVFGSLLSNPVAQALVACRVKVVACMQPGTCPHGGVVAALLISLALKVVDSYAKGGGGRFLVITSRPELQQLTQQLVARGWSIALATTLETMPRDGTISERYTWPQLYPHGPGAASAGGVDAL